MAEVALDKRYTKGTERAIKHAHIVHTCPLCNREIRGNSFFKHQKRCKGPKEKVSKIRPLISLGDGLYQIILTRGKVAIIDACDVEKVKASSWSSRFHKKTGLWYAEGWMNGKRVLLHRYILDLMQGQFADHINGDGLDNRRFNLRLCTRKQNTQNVKTRTSLGKTSQYKGVCYSKASQKWMVQVAGEYIGLFEGEEEAARIYDEKAKLKFGEFARLNFPLEGGD